MNQSDFQYPNLRIWTLAVDSMDEMLFFVDEQGTVLAANRAVGRWGLCEVENAVNQPFHQVVHKNCQNPNCYLQVLWARFKRFAESRSKVEQEIKDRYLDKMLYLCFESVNPAKKDFIEKSKRPFAMLAFRDVSALRQRQEVERRQMLFETFHFVLRSLFHEIGNPLAAMRTTVEVLQGNLDSFPREKASEYLDRVIEGTERLQVILERADRDKYFPEITLAPVSLKHLFQRMYRLFEDEFKAWGIQFEVVLPSAGKDRQLLLDLMAIEEVIVNLIKNAREASKPSERVKLCHHFQGSQVHLIIQDTGRGMDQDALNSLFIPKLSAKPGGRGLGLGYSNYLVSKMGGTFRVESKPGEGTTVTMIFENEKTRQPPKEAFD